METHLADFIQGTRAGQEAEEILRRCVHCGFCTATCPTYQVLGDELDGPRGRIYLIKAALEGSPVSERTLSHLDRCLLCRACETTCPSGVHYSRLLEIGREVVARRVGRPLPQRFVRTFLRATLSRPLLFASALRLGQLLRPVLPRGVKKRLPPLVSAGVLPTRKEARRMLVLEGCVQPSMYPNINGAAMRVLAHLGITLIKARQASCCGAIRLHLEDTEGARIQARRNIDAFWPEIEAGAEAIVLTASACAVQLKDYGHLLADDPHYAAKAQRIAAMAKDASEVVAAEKTRLQTLLADLPPAGRRLAFHAPCTLQHGLKIRGVIEELLMAAGFELVAVADAHLCCGSAGTYSLLQPEIAQRLRTAKLAALTAGAPDGIASANVGCIAHLAAESALPVRHWLEWIDERLTC
ncbi:MAG: glycolate oxidase subunit GlcF [Rhodocyclaceae bacterium]|nr:glycolate oxidase subunit GlcF [Rhodocyclaceae bacterium]